ncbi:MAG: EamA family transporter [Bacteroidota bacterium]
MKKALFQLHIAVFLAGFTAILGKLMGLNEGILVWYRMLLTALTLAAILYYRKELVKLSFKETINVFAVGCIIAVHWVTFYGSVKYGNVSIAVVCISGSGFFTAFFDPIINRRKISFIEVLLGTIAIVGIYIIFDFHPQYKLGIIFGIISAIGSSLFPIFNKRLLVKHDPETLTLYEMSGGFLALTVIIPFYLQVFPADYYLPTTHDWLWLLLLAWVCTVFCFDLQLNALKKLSPFTCNLAYNLEPVYGIILAFIFFKENKDFNSHFYIGVGLILLAVILQTIRIWYSRSRSFSTLRVIKPE